MACRLVKTDRLVVDDGVCVMVRYSLSETPRGRARFSSEIVLPSSEVIILDEDSLATLESRVRGLVPAMVYSRTLAARATAA